MKKSDQQKLNHLFEFLHQAPTAWHTVDLISKELASKGFTKLNEGEAWSLTAGESYFVTRDNSSICAFIMPQNSCSKIRLIASHLDSPSLKLKPTPELHKQNMILIGVEVYGAPLLSSWLNRDLGIAGRVVYINESGEIQESLVNLKENPLIIPQLAIHLDREVNEKGLLLNKQDQLFALAALKDSASSEPYLETLLRKVLSFKEIISHDLFFYPLEEARFIGPEKQMMASYRIDSLASVHAALHALLENLQPCTEEIKMIAFWNHEEVGSHSALGASSPFLSQVIERISSSREAFFQLIHRSSCISIDLAHACHHNHIEKHDPQHLILLGKGVVVKTNAQQRYASNARSYSSIFKTAKEAHLPLQNFVSRNDIPCGSTIGPLHAAATGMMTVDIGAPQLSMHSIREVMASKDQLDCYHLLTTFLNSKKQDHVY